MHAVCQRASERRWNSVKSASRYCQIPWHAKHISSIKAFYNNMSPMTCLACEAYCRLEVEYLDVLLRHFHRLW